MIADELENELAATELAEAGALRLARDWDDYADQLRFSKETVDALSTTLRRALLEPAPIEGAAEHAKLFEEAAAQLRRLVESAHHERGAR